MKKFTSIILTIATIFSITTSAFAAGTPAPYTREVTLRGSVNIVYNGEEQALLDADGRDVMPVFFDGTHYLPIRALSGLAGLNVDWDATTRTVILTSGGTVVTNPCDIVADDYTGTATVATDVTVTLDGVKKTFKTETNETVYPVIYKGTTFLPVRAVANLVGLNINWDGPSKTVSITSPDYVDPKANKGTAGIAPVPAGNILATESMTYVSPVKSTANNGTQRWLTAEECKALGVENGIVIDKRTADYASAGVAFSGVSYSSVSYSIVAPSDEDVKTSVSIGPDAWKRAVAAGSTAYVTAGTSQSFTVGISGQSHVGIAAAALADNVYYIVNISFQK